MKALRKPIERIQEYVRELFGYAPATITLICITIFVFLSQELFKLLLGNDFLLTIGSKKGRLLVTGEVWRLITPVFLHTHLVHLITNIVVLYAIGSTVEKFFRSSRLLSFYLLSGIGCNTVSMILCPHECVGGSGAIMGLVGGLAAFLVRNIRVFGWGGMLRSGLLMMVALLSLGFGQVDSVDPWGHLGGLLTGLFLGWFYGPLLKSETSISGEMKLVDARPFTAVRMKFLIASTTILATSIVLIVIPL